MSPVFAGTPDPVTGLVKIEGKSFHRQFTYETQSGAQIVVPTKIKGVKDLRSYPDQHPIWVKTQVGFAHWNPVTNGLGAASGGALSGYALWKLFH